jgi:hypothetical protein
MPKLGSGSQGIDDLKGNRCQPWLHQGRVTPELAPGTCSFALYANPYYNVV